MLLAEGVPCDDNNPETINDIINGGVCIGTCDDNDVSTVDSLIDGVCKYVVSVPDNTCVGGFELTPYFNDTKSCDNIPELVNLNNWDKTTGSYNGTVHLLNNTNLVDISGLNNIYNLFNLSLTNNSIIKYAILNPTEPNYILQNVTVSYNNSLISFRGESLKSNVHTYKNNPLLENLEGFNNTLNIDQLVIENNGKLVNVNAYLI